MTRAAARRLLPPAILLATFCTLAQAQPSAADLSLDFDAPDWQSATHITVRGAPERVDGKTGQALRFGVEDALSFPSDVLNLNEGTIEMDVAPHWPEGDTGRHTFFHLGDGQRHITLFRVNPGVTIFVYKASMSEWHGTRLRTDPWRPGEWHHLAAAWRPGLNGGLVLTLSVDGVLSVAQGAIILPDKPETCWLGSRGNAEPAQASIDNFNLHSRYAMPKPVGSAPATVAARIDCRAPEGPMPRPFSFTTPWNSSEFRLPFDRSHPYYRLFTKAGFEMVRLVAFSEGWLWGTEVTRGADGKIALDFSDFDAWMDLFRSAGAEPYIRLAYHLPSALRNPDRDTGTAHYSLPADLNEWDRLMRDIVAHCNVERKLGIRYWVTMLNEADLDIRKGHANWEDMFRLYEITTRAVKETSPESKVGGPATCGPMPGVQDEGMRQFIRFCRERNLPPDFLCYHQYNRTHPKGFETATNRVKEIVAEEWPELDAELFLDEWSLWAGDSRQNTEYAAAYHAAGVHYQIRAGVARSSIVSFNPHVPQVAQPPRRVEGIGPMAKDERWRAARFYVDHVTLDGERLQVLYTHSPASTNGSDAYTYGRFTGITIPPNAVLNTAVAQAITGPGADGCMVSVHVIASDGEKEILTFPSTQTTWSQHRIPLGAFAGQTVDIEFRTRPGGKTNYDHALWGEPRIIADGKTVYDFCTQIDRATTGVFDAGVKWYDAQPTLPMLKDNIVTPVYYTWSLLNKLRGERLTVALDGDDGIHSSDVLGVLACKDREAVRVLAWHYDDATANLLVALDDPELRVPKTVELTFDGLDGAWRLTRYLIDRDHSNPYTDYVREGKGDRDGRYNIDQSEADIVEQRTVQAHNGTLRIPVGMDNLTVTLLDLQPE